MFYVYDFGDVGATHRWSYDRFFYDRWCREACAALSADPRRTADPSEAACFVVAATLRCVSFANVDRAQLDALVASLPHRKTGKAHVVFDLTDEPNPMYVAPDVITCKSAFLDRFFDARHGVAIPQFPRYRFARAFRRASERPRLAGFKGNLRARFGDLRTRLLALHDGERFVVDTGVLMPNDIHISGDDACESVRPGATSYTELLFESTFALLPRARGYALSYRMVEAMNAGCVPVVISDGYVLPFSDTIDYAECAIRVAEADVEHLPDILQARFHEADAMQAASYRVYQRYFSSTARIVAHAVSRAAEVAARWDADIHLGRAHV